MTDAFSAYDAAYLLDALSADDKTAYQRHLADCPDCAEALHRLQWMPAVLDRVRGSGVPHWEPRATADASAPHELVQSELVQSELVPPEILPRLLAATTRQRRRRRWTAALAAAAAAAVVCVVLVAAQHGEQVGRTAVVAMRTVSPESPIRATAQLVAEPWGAHVRLRCTYEGGPGYPSSSYSLVVISRSGQTQQISTWKVVPGRISTVDGSTSLHLSDIASVQVRNPQSTPVLTLNP